MYNNVKKEEFMFKKYNVNDLYKATIDVVYHTIGSHYLLISHDYKGGYSYNTILFKIKKVILILIIQE